MLYAVCAGEGCDRAGSEMIGDLGRKDSQIEIAISSARMTTIDESNVAVRIDDHVTQCQIPVRDDEILGWSIGNEAREQILGRYVAIARGKLSGIDVALRDGVSRSLKPHREAFIEGAVGRR